MDHAELAASVNGWDLLFKYHGRPSGIYSADEYLAGLEAVRGTELCLVVETMFSYVNHTQMSQLMPTKPLEVPIFTKSLEIPNLLIEWSASRTMLYLPK